MADKTQNVKTRLSFDGEAEYKAACKEINSTLKVLNSEMKLVTAEYKDNASSVDALKAKQSVLQKTYDEQAKKVTRMYITPAPTHGTSLSVKSADRQKCRRAAMKKQYGIFLQARA